MCKNCIFHSKTKSHAVDFNGTTQIIDFLSYVKSPTYSGNNWTVNISYIQRYSGMKSFSNSLAKAVTVWI